MNVSSTPSPQKANSPAPQKEKPLQYTDDLGSILKRVEAHGTENNKELSEEENKHFLECESMMQEGAKAGCKSLFLTGLALKIMKEERLFRRTHTSIEEFAKGKYNIKLARVSQLIGYADDVCAMRAKFLETMPGKSSEEITQLLPISETHTRALNGLDGSEMTEVWAEVIAVKPVDQVTAEYVKEVREKKFPTTKKTRKAAAQKTDDPVHVMASVTNGKMDIVTEPAKPQDGFKIELTMKSGSIKEIKDALRSLAGKKLSEALKKAA